ncbi:MAG: flagellar export chaperone FliS [Candidatus Cloacimonadota bacterium]|nr:MAG: flagellar export chaperone FliS [Candidatus Cloacimonadota bacterium]
MAVPYSNQMNQYKRMRIETASPEMLILMLYDGAIKNINIAASCLDDDTQIETSNNALIKAQNILTELMVSLNFDIGGDIAKNLYNIYEYLNYTLAQANMTKDAKELSVATDMLKNLRETWKEVIRINKEKYPNGIPKPVIGKSTNDDINQKDIPKTVAPIVSQTPISSNPVVSQSAKANAQTNRFRQIYGKNMPNKK